MSFKVLCAIECLKDIGLSRTEIDDRINGWVAKAGFSGDWAALPDKAQESLAAAMQKYFETLFNGRKAA